ncbi:MAG: MazG-like family protein [Beijerinckiaceae bacterium]
MSASVQDLIEQLRRFRDERNWQQFHAPKDLAISVSIEAAELLELFQWRPVTERPNAAFLTNVGSEAADVLLYLLLLCDALDIKLLEEAQAKIERNKARFPVASSQGIAKPLDRTSLP